MITPRLQMILKNITSDSVADIGTDHAYIPIALSERGIKVIATDINFGPLAAAEKNIQKKSLSVTLLSGDGLKPIKNADVKEIIVAGMGGELIEKILSDEIETAYSARLLLQPMKQQAELRKFLLTHGFLIEKEDLAAEGHKIYNLIIAKKGTAFLPQSELDLHLPPSLYNHPLFPMLLAKKQREFSKQFDGLSKGKNKDFTELMRLDKLLSDIKKLKDGITI